MPLPPLLLSALHPLRLVRAGCWVLATVLALVAGWQVHERLALWQNALHLPGRVVARGHSTVAGPTATSPRTQELRIEVDVADPRRNGRVERLSLLSPGLFLTQQPGDTVTVLHDPLTLPAQEPFVLAHPAHDMLAPALALGAAVLLLAWPGAGRWRRLGVLAALTAAPVLVGQAAAWSRADTRAADAALEARWPAWPELDAAVPRPWWWARLPWRGMNPAGASGELAGAAEYWLDTHTPWPHAEAGLSERRFKWARARVLAFKDRPRDLAGLISAGHDPNFVPLYRFFLTHYLQAQWNDPACSRCNDPSQTTEIAGDLMYLLVQNGDLDEAWHWAVALPPHKLAQADTRARLSFLIAYRGLLEAREGVDAARATLLPLVEDAEAAARSAGDTWALPRWQAFWQAASPKPPAVTAR
ncbi:hypothetical protein [Roseateles sp. BYS87W]|uniref:DUF4175 domain-containing protein n=1 Tax=Pelomonas baiyunensis TaxID=3299026 RepID=A0ABW7H1A3_9BURK